jgi:hypothetical protein
MIEIEPGKIYRYKRPHWNKSVRCMAVVDMQGDLAFAFHAGYYPIKVRNLPTDYIIEKEEKKGKENV